MGSITVLTILSGYRDSLLHLGSNRNISFSRLDDSDYWNTDLMADQILKLIRDTKMSKQGVQKNRRALKSLTWDKAADKIIEAYSKLF